MNLSVINDPFSPVRLLDLSKDLLLVSGPNVTVDINSEDGY